MAILDIVFYPDKRLSRKSEGVQFIDDDIVKLLDDMADTMYDAPGVGLAAPQVGRNIRAIVVDTTSSYEGEGGSGLLQLVNPVIVSSSGEQIGEEGCLSVPGFVANVKRKQKVVVEALDRDAKPVSIQAEDMLARVLQHEIDHLDGILFFERLGKLKKQLLLKKINRSFAAA